jgi:hypothetical protein
MCKEFDAEWEALREELDTAERSDPDEATGGRPIPAAE